MKKSRNEIEVVEFQRCVSRFCDRETDLICVSCDKWFCSWDIKECVQCEQVVCKECYEQDLCCLVKPWGEKEERHLKDFYRNKLVGEGMNSFNDNVKYGKEYRMEAVKRTIEHYVDTFNASFLRRCKPVFVRDYFPRIEKYVENEEMRREFVAFMESLWRQRFTVFVYVFLKDEGREDLFIVLTESIRSNEKKQSDLVFYAMESKELFHSLKKRKLLDWNLLGNKYFIIKHVDALKWIEQNGIDVVNNEEHFNQFVLYSPPEIMEYLIVEKGMTVEYMSENFYDVKQDILQMIYRLKGMEGIQKIDSEKFGEDFEVVKFLRSIGYKFGESLISRRNISWFYALICFKVLKYEDLNENQSRAFDEYVSKYDIKACKHLYPFMKEIRRKKIMTVILCIRKTCILSKGNHLEYSRSRLFTNK